MEIKDYLHLYMGCEVKAFFEQTEQVETGYLTGIHGEYGPEIQFIIDGNAEESPEYVDYDKVKPILRKLSDMTEEEMKELIQFDKMKTEYGDVEFKFNGLDSIMVTYGKAQAKWKMNFFAADMHDHAWMLRKGFDLFGLIPAGLAIDKTSLKN